MILVGGQEVLYDDTIRVADKAKAAGVDVTVDVDEDMFHIYPAFGGIFKNGQDATNRMVAFMEKHST